MQKVAYVSIIGASGYTGQEALDRVLAHRELELHAVGSDSLAGRDAVVGALLLLASLIWTIALLVTTAQSPTKQGLHDQFAKTVVVKAARAVG
jgi:N-acetyl-gamma-glutamylphosphate reductase